MPLTRVRRIRDEIEAGKRVGPHLRVAGPVIDGMNTAWQNQLGIPDDREATAAIGLLADQGADFVKIYPMLTREAYFAIVKEAARRHLPVAGQVPDTISIEEASSAGQKSLEHLEKLILGCSSIEQEVTATREAILKEDHPLERMLAVVPRQSEQMLDSLNPTRCRAVLRTLARNRTWVVPALVSEDAFRAVRHDRNDPRLAYLPPALREAWLDMDIALTLMLDDEARLNARLETTAKSLLRPLGDSGVPMLAGTNAGAQTPFVFPGFSLHDELKRMVAAGLSPLAALQTATIQPARFFGEENRYGSVQSGKSADLVLLDANPLDEVGNLSRIAGVVTNGQYLDRRQLDRLLAAVRRLHAEPNTLTREP